MYFEILDQAALQQYMKYWDREDWSEILDEGNSLYPNHIAFGIREKWQPAALLVAEMTEERAEVRKLLFCSEAALEELMLIFRHHVEGSGYDRICYQWVLPQEQADQLRGKLQKAGWTEAAERETVFQIRRAEIPFWERATKGSVKGEVVPLFETSEALRMALVEELPEDTKFFRYENILPEFSLAYVENGKIEGYFLSVERKGEIWLIDAKWPEKQTAKGALIIGMAVPFQQRKAPWMYVVSRDVFSERIMKTFFKKQIMGVQSVLRNKEEPYGDL
ncbi:MAG: hypothetical protein Q4C06_01195 [Bacillota bacterium]|nr:hypothetical protein [Bacillota bacterium]